eukprot:TRINITY_DN5536_c0_g1_i2.p1 TRINITY_DN5536_c0_g1~~TRINITY_DN5536_c0_g1_i2.p1  ORF type:complete len:433 (+),score=85.96 TRINITY_DN5536_c0_g1_i2:134-1432(+)
MPFGGIQQIVDGLTRDDSVCLTNHLEQNAVLPDQVVMWNYPSSESYAAMRRTLLQIAAYYGSVGCMRMLLGRGAAVNCVSVDDGKTALDCALEGNSAKMLEAVRLLLENGATLDSNSAAGLGVQQPTEALERRPSTDLTKPCYQSDGFRMYGFKIAECTKEAPHDWTECPFLHPGEKARRRDPRQFTYSPEPCPDYRRGSCKRGDGCGYAHGVFEAWLHPTKYRTQLCKDGLACSRHTCFFAHHLAELRAADAPAQDAADFQPPSPSSSIYRNQLSDTIKPHVSLALSPTSSINRSQNFDNYNLNLSSPLNLNLDVSSSINPLQRFDSHVSHGSHISHGSSCSTNPLQRFDSQNFQQQQQQQQLLNLKAIQIQQCQENEALKDAILALAGLKFLQQASAVSSEAPVQPDACGLLSTNNFVNQAPFGGLPFQF